MFSDSDDDAFDSIISINTEGNTKPGVTFRGIDQVGEEESGFQTVKRAKLSELGRKGEIKFSSTSKDIGKPAVEDAFEQELARQVDADDGPGKLELRHQIRHEVAVPPGYPYIPISQHVPSETPARVYPFTLDPFQRVAIHSIERNESVLVAAHTSAGKTVVAEYAIAQALRNNQRVIYTSPIKALSNQKFREFSEEFGDVGLLTGDVTISPQATCLVMTTEILRSMLYRGSEVMREVAWVIFDEVHYMRDKARGVVWEETMILLPHNVRHVFLSATIPNAHQFARWICELHQQPCHVVYTDFRPTPLQHFLYPEGSNGILLVVDEESKFRSDNFEKAMSLLRSAPENDALAEEAGGSGRGLKHRKKRIDTSEDSDIARIIKMILERNYHPVIVFSFGKRDCETYANAMSVIDFNTAREQELVAQVFSNAIAPLDSHDRELPQIQSILPLLKRGIGIHHSGLLPVLKEVIEILFQEGLIKVLFATETFSIGLNMPAKTVVFTSVSKFDGTSLRSISSGEYIQMSGRAGRRGLDARGIVIMMINEKIEPGVVKNMIQGQSDVLNSAFHITDNMLLNQLRVEGISPERMLECCFLHFQSREDLPRLTLEKNRLENRINLTVVDERIGTYYKLKQMGEEYRQQIRDLCNHPKKAIPFLTTGRLVKVEYNGLDFGTGVIIKFEKVRSFETGKPVKSEDNDQTVVYVLLEVEGGSLNHRERPKPCPVLPEGLLPAKNNTGSNTGSMRVVPILLQAIAGLSSIVIKLSPDVTSSESLKKIKKTFEEVARRFNGDLKFLDPVEHLKVDPELANKCKSRISKVEARLAEITAEFGGADLIPGKLDVYQRQLADKEALQTISNQIKEAQAVVKLDELKCRKRVLRLLGYISDSDVVEVKGRVACEIQSEYGLLLAELIFQGIFNALTVEQTAALLSIFVYDERLDEKANDTIPPSLVEPFRLALEHARKIATASLECKVPIDVEQYVSGLNPGLILAVHEWCRGASFMEICEMTPAFEGSIIRVFRRLEESIRQMAMAAKAIGNVELEAKFSHAILLMKRGIIFSASLYL